MPKVITYRYFLPKFTRLNSFLKVVPGDHKNLENLKYFLICWEKT